MSGDRLVVGAEGAHVGMGQVQGAAYVFFKGPSGWTLEDKLVGNDSTTFDNFAQSVAIEGDRVVVGCVGADNGQGSGSFDGGAVYVFERSGNDWLQTAKLVVPVAFQNERLGRKVALSGDTVAAGTPGAMVNGMQRRGAVDVFERIGGVWTQDSRFEAYDGVPGQSFGIWLAASDSTVMVGASTHDASRGAVYLMFDGLLFKDGFEEITP